MTESPRVAVVIRFRDEARWLQPVLAAVRAQRCAAEVELIGGDNASADGSRAVAEDCMDQVLHIEDYHPGAALNKLIASARSETVVVLSAHALPANERWLASLLDGLADPGALAVYGAQVFPLNSPFVDKRDLDIFAHPRSRRETADSVLWNANAAFPRREWERQPFEETVMRVEDHYWTKCLLPSQGRFVRYTPNALVYHYGHDVREDRIVPLPVRPGDIEVIQRAIDALEHPNEAWPAVMSAGIALERLSHVPAARRAVPAMGRQLREHPDFDVRWQMA
ncbi:MAG: glycosyltransferase, partial [Solirubrobacterales bacterium]|nr:glycosyltransferase [Solirubrobacterales bacterium]